MARVKLVEKEQAQPEIKELFQKIEDKGAIILNLYKAAAVAPTVAQAFFKLGNLLFNKTELPEKLRELAILRVAKLTGSKYEWTQHVLFAMETGVTQQQVDAIEKWKESPNFNDLERAVLQYTDEVAVNVEVSDKTFETLRKHLNERSIVELTISIGYWGMIARLLVPLKVEIDKHSVTSAKELLGKNRPR